MARGITGKALSAENPTAAASTQSGLGAPLFCLSASFDTDDEVIVADAPFTFRVIDVIVHCEETNATGSCNIERNGTDIMTTDLTCDTNHEVTSLSGNLDGAGAVGILDDAQHQVAVGDSLEVTPTNSAKGTVTLICVRT
jgi:hypothetical protein